MDEPLALLIMLPALLFGIWAIDLAGANALGVTTAERAATDAAQVAAAVIADQTPRAGSDDVVAHDARDEPIARARLAAQAVVRAAAIGVCTDGAPSVEVNHDEVAREVTVVVVCAVRVSGPLSRTVVASATADVGLDAS